MSRDSTHAAPLGGLTPPRGFKCHPGATPASPPQPRQVPDAPLGSLHRPGWREPRAGVGPAPSPQPPARSGVANPHLVTGQPALRALEVWTGVAHKDVPLAGDGPDGLWGGAAVHPPALAAGQVEQGELARWGGGSVRPGWPQDGGPHPCPRDPRLLTQSLMSCSVAAARRTGHLCRVLSGVYRAKECLASLNTGTSAVTSLRNTWMYCMQGVGVSGTLDGAPAPWGEQGQRALGSPEWWGSMRGGRHGHCGGSLLSRSLSGLFDV